MGNDNRKCLGAIQCMCAGTNLPPPQGLRKAARYMPDGRDQSGITAVASISTSHSGRASAETTMPVDTGYTPFNHFPVT